MKPRYRFTLSNASDSMEISEPIGWSKIELNLERHPEYHSLVENFEVPLIFYGSDGVKDGGYDWIKQYLTQSIAFPMYILIEVQPNEGDAYETLFDGRLDVKEYVDTVNLSLIEIPIIRNDFWARFIAKKGVKVDIKSTTDVNDDGSIGIPTFITVRPSLDLALPSQQIRQEYQATHADDISYVFTGTGQYGILDFATLVRDEINEKYPYPRIVNGTTRPFELFALEYAGDYTFDIKITLSTALGPFNGGDSPVSANMKVKFQVNDDAAIDFAQANAGTPGSDGRTDYTYTDTHTLKKGDFIRVYIFNNTGGGVTVVWLDFYTNYMNVTADTVFPDSTAETMLAHDVALSVIDRIVSTNDSLYSEYFGGGGTAIPYSSDGCGYQFVLLKGLHLRGYDFTDKPFALSFEDWWDGMNPIFGLGLGYEDLDASPSKEVIRIEEMAHFYDGTSSSVTLSQVEDPEGFFDVQLFVKNLTFGYGKWEAESASGIDDPQTKHWYSMAFVDMNKGMEILSSFYAAALGIEQARRNTVVAGDDYRLDEDTVIIHADLTATPEQARRYPGVATGILNPDTRYNLKLTPYANAYRWNKFTEMMNNSAGIAFFKFMKAEGNVSLNFTDGLSTDCEPNVWAENSNLGTGGTPLHSLYGYRFTHPLTYTQYKAIRDNRKKEITFTYTDKNGAVQSVECFIKKLKYAINESKGTFEVWKKLS